MARRQLWIHALPNSTGRVTDCRLKTGASGNGVNRIDRPTQPPDGNSIALFYGREMTDAIAGRVWTWLCNAALVEIGLLTRDHERRAVGLAHVRACCHYTLSDAVIGFLDDLSMMPITRGSGAANALFAA